MESTGRALSIILSNLWTNEFRKSADCVARHLEKLLHWIDSLSEDELFYLNNGLGRPPKHNGLFGNGFTLIALPLLLVSERKFANGKACL